MHICLIDFRLSGHHPFYLANFAHVFQKLGCQVDVFTSDVDRCSELVGKALPELELDTVEFVRTSASTINGRRRWGCRAYFNLVRLEKEIKKKEREKGVLYDLVYFAYLDDVTLIDFILPYLIKSPFSMKFSGLLVAPREKVLRKLPTIFDRFFTNCLSHKSAACSEIGILVEDVQSQVRQETDIDTIVYPDFCSQMPLEQISCPINDEVIRKRRGRVTTSLLGSIQPHKSVDLFLECVRVADPEKYFFVIAGYFHRTHFSDEQWLGIEKVMTNPPENLLIFNQWLDSERVFDSLVQCSDYLFAVYRNFTKSSNVVTKSALYKTPVIVSDDHLIGSRVNQYKIGFALTEERIPTMYKKNLLLDFSYDEDLRREFVELHSVQRLDAIFSRLLGLDA